jgi:ADP-ribose diphosphatase
MSLHVGHWDEPYVRLGTGVFVVPINARGDVLFVIEPAIPDNSPVLSLPSGAIDPGESSLEAAHRELQEEVGYKAGRINFLCEVNPMGKHAVSRNFIFLARDLIPSKQQGDETWPIQIEPIPFDGFESLIEMGRLKYATVIVALFMARRFMQKEA